MPNSIVLHLLGETFYLRARGTAASGFSDGSRSSVQSVGLFARGALADPLFGNGFG